VDTALGRAETRKERGNVSFKEGDYPQAAAHYTSALELNPAHHVALANRSACFLKMGEHEKALADAETCVRAAPEFVKGHFRRVLLTLVPIRPRSRGERRSLRTFSPGASLRPHHGFNPSPPSTPFNSNRRLSTPPRIRFVWTLDPQERAVAARVVEVRRSRGRARGGGEVGPEERADQGGAQDGVVQSAAAAAG